MQGYVRANRGFVVSSDGITDTAYVADREGTGTGFALKIRVYAKPGTSVDYAYRYSITPVIPYRLLVFGDTPLDNRDFFRGTNASASVPLFNPGVTYSDVLDGLPADLWHLSVSELNCTRSMMDKISASPYVKAYRTDVSKFALYRGVEVHDTNASILLKTIDTSTDKIILSVVTKIQGSVVPNSTGSPIQIRYTVPLILKYTVDKTKSSDYQLLPDAWSYAVPSDLIANGSAYPTDFLPVARGRLSESYNGSLDSQHWNWNAIPIILNGRYDLQPYDLGSLCSSVSDGVNVATVVAYSAFKSDAWYSQYAISHFDGFWDASGYVQNTDTKVARKKYRGYFFPSMTTAAFNNGLYLFSVSSSFRDRSVSELVAVNSTFDSTAAKTIFCKSLSVTEQSNGFYVGGVSGDTFKFYDTGDATTLISRISPLSLTIQDLPNSAHRLGFTDVGITKKGISHDSSPLSSVVKRLGIDSTFTMETNSENTYVGAQYDVMYVNNLGGATPVATDIVDGNSIVLNPNYALLDSSKAQLMATPSGSNTWSVLTQLEGQVTVKELKSPSFTIADSGIFRYSSSQNADSSNGVNTLLEINCSGIFSTGTWVEKIADGQKGVRVDRSKTRDDFRFSYDGRSDDFTYVGGWGYWANIVKPSIEVEVFYGTAAPRMISRFNGAAFARYDTTGNCILEAGLTLFLDGVKDSLGRNYEDEGYDLTDLTAKLRMNSAESIAQTITGLEFSPPSPTVSISTAATKYVSRLIPLSLVKTSVRSIVDNVVVHEINNKVEKAHELTNIKSLFNDNASYSGSKNVSVGSCTKGDYFFFTWIEGINGRLFNKTSGIKSYVKGHRYLLSSPTILIDGTDKTSEITNTDFVVIKPGGGSANVEVSFTLTHEDFSSRNRSQDGVPTDNNRYPVLETVYLFLVPRQSWPRVETHEGRQYWFEEQVPVGSPITYPNGTSTFVSALAAASSFDTSISYGGTTITATDDIDLDIDENGTYQIFLVARDEFNQYSVFHITSLHKIDGRRTYRTQFSEGT